jgi:hypothetical protein
LRDEIFRVVGVDDGRSPPGSCKTMLARRLPGIALVHRLPKAGRYTSVRRFGRGKRVTSAAVPSISVELSDFLR